MAKICAQEVNEGSTSWLYFTLKDRNGVGVSVSNIVSATMSLYDDRSEAIINNRDEIDVKSYFDSSGYFEFKLTEDDNQVINCSVMPHELHHAVIVVKISQGAETDTHVETFIVKVLQQKFMS